METDKRIPGMRKFYMKIGVRVCVHVCMYVAFHTGAYGAFIS